VDISKSRQPYKLACSGRHRFTEESEDEADVLLMLTVV